MVEKKPKHILHKQETSCPGMPQVFSFPTSVTEELSKACTTVSVRSGGSALDSCKEWCRYPTGALDSCQEWCEYPACALANCQEWCRFSAGALASCQEWCRYSAGALASCQEWCRYSAGALASCPEWCRYSAGALASARSGAEIGSPAFPWLRVRNSVNEITIKRL